MNFGAEKNIHDLSNILQKLISSQGITVAELARRINLPQPTIQRIASGVYKQPRTSTLQPIADYFQITLNQLRGYEPIEYLSRRENSVKSIPILTMSQINNWPNILEDTSHHVTCDKNFSKNSFAMYMPDYSMEPAFTKGTLLLIDPSRTPHHKSTIVLKLRENSDVLVRQLITDGKNRFIKPLSPELNHLALIAIKDTDSIVGVVMEARLICENFNL
jgi:SOS-response transcriptional repressor LexA